jgi:hypothetical protein
LSETLDSVSELAVTDASGGSTLWPTVGGGAPFFECSEAFARLYGIAAASSAVPASLAASASLASARATSGFVDGALTVLREEDFVAFAFDGDEGLDWAFEALDDLRAGGAALRVAMIFPTSDESDIQRHVDRAVPNSGAPRDYFYRSSHLMFVRENQPTSS